MLLYFKLLSGDIYQILDRHFQLTQSEVIKVEFGKVVIISYEKTHQFATRRKYSFAFLSSQLFSQSESTRDPLFAPVQNWSRDAYVKYDSVLVLRNSKSSDLKLTLVNFAFGPLRTSDNGSKAKFEDE